MSLLLVNKCEVKYVVNTRILVRFVFPPNMLKNNNYFNGTKHLIYEDDQSFVLEEKSNTQGSLHLLVVPKKNMCISTNALTDDKKLFGHLILVANKVAIQKGFEGNSYEILINEDSNSGKVKFIRVIRRISKHISWPIIPNSRF